MNGSKPTTKAGPLCALLLTGLDEAVSVEHAALRQAGVVRVRTLTSGAQGLGLLAKQLAERQARHSAENALEVPAGLASNIYETRIDLVICTDNMLDMDIAVFLRELAALCGNNGWRNPPVVAVTGDPEAQATFLGLGAGAVLLRPYSVNLFCESVRRLLENVSSQAAGEAVSSGAGQAESAAGSARNFISSPVSSSDQGAFFARRQQDAHKKLDPQKSESEALQAAGDIANPAGSGAARAAASEAGHEAASAVGVETAQEAPATVEEYAATANPLLYTRKGLGLLRDGRLEDAEDMLRRALDYDGLDLEACLGLVRVCAQLGDQAGELRWLNRALIICVETGQKERADSIRPRPPKQYGSDPYLAEARNLLAEEAYDAAAELFMSICARQREIPLHELVARACQFTDWPETAIRELCSAFARAGHSLTARNLYHRLLADTDPGEFTPLGFLARFPRLYEAVAVAKFTMHAWKRAAQA